MGHMQSSYPSSKYNQVWSSYKGRTGADDFNHKESRRSEKSGFHYTEKWILPDDVGAANALSPPEEAGGDPKASKKLVCCCGCAEGCCCGCWGGVPNAAKLGCDCCWTGCGADDPNGSKVF